MRTFHIKTLGCKVNQYDSQAIRESLQGQGFCEVGLSDKPDMYIVNTCTVTAAADRKSRQSIRQLMRTNQQAKMLVTGCLVNKDAKNLSQEISGVDYFISKSFFKDNISDFAHHCRAFVKVQDGCNLRCSFCKVWQVRGKSRSRKREEIVLEVRRLLDRGFKEIVLTGICLGSFGKDLEPAFNLVGLIEEILKLRNLGRLRLSSIEPKFVDTGLIDLLSAADKLCKHLHIPLQSGDAKILKLMNRNYIPGGFLKLVERIRERVPGIGVTTDVMVGFPYEREENFKNTLEILEQIMPLRTHCFLYSPRLGTQAQKCVKFIADSQKLTERMHRLRCLSSELSSKFRSQFLNQELEILAEEKKDGFLSGYSSNYIKVNFSGDQDGLNKIIKVRVEKVCPEFTLGSLKTGKSS